MKCTVELRDPPVPKFPALYRAIKNGQIVLFKELVVGTVVHQGNCWHIGGSSLCWTPCTDTDTWVRLQPGETVILENDE